MIYIPYGATNEQVLEIIHAWVDLLARDDYDTAFAQIGTHGIRGDWSVEFLRSDIQSYRSEEFYPGETEFRVTDWRTAQGGNPQPQHEVGWFSEGFVLVGAIDFDMPLNGRWSDLNAQFLIWDDDTSEAGYPLMLEEFLCAGERHPAF